MEDNKKRKTIHHFDQFGIEQFVVRNLQRIDPSLDLVPLRDVVRDIRELIEATFSPHMSQFIGIEQVGASNDIIWAPSPLDENWFQRLALEGHSGKRIVITSTDEAKKEFEPFATSPAIEIPMFGGIAKLIHKALTDPTRPSSK